ncbi:GNAT family N-acetyltransferase [Actinoplanes sp. RD1]|uniref:GNAT family N-acetyltransferase n=1 Tax=Actinoplanes sp. RD1 TaxID=3064538 RepID=UPI00274155F4|nr:GNAT family N-acetyltransferase [Actinoplanes sp. RD1]
MIELRALPGDDPLLHWTAQDFRAGVRAWSLGDAVAVACPDVGRRDRIAVRGDAETLGELLQRIRPEFDDFHPWGDADLVPRIPGLRLAGTFGWMDTGGPVPAGAHPDELADLTDEAEITAFLQEHHPHSFALPGGTGITRWVGLRDEAGRLLAVAADAWSTSTVASIGGVATRTDMRGRGLARRVCGALTAQLSAGRRTVSLLVDLENVPALRTYERLGYRLRRVAAASYAD